MTAQPSSQAEREDVAREVLVDLIMCESPALLRRGVVDAVAMNMDAVRCSPSRVIRAMLAFSDREHATPRSMPEEVVEALATRDRKAGECPDKLLNLDKACPRCGALSNEGCRITIIADARFVHTIRALIPGASA